MFSECTPLAACSSPPSYSQPDWQSCSGEADEMYPEETDARRQRMREYYNSVFRAGGVDLALRNVAVVQESVLHQYCPALRRRGRICCQGVSAHFRKGGLHLVADVDKVAGAAVLDAVSGRCACTAGEVWVDGAVIGTQARAQYVACVEQADVPVSRLSVEDHLWLVVHLHRKERRSWKREVILAAANFAHLDPRARVNELSATERLRLQVALGLAVDPPALILAYPFEDMSLAQQIESMWLLHRLTTELHKTVVVSTRTLPMHLFTAADSLLLLGASGLMLYSGTCIGAIPYFNQLRIPRHVPEPLWKSIVTPTQEGVAVAAGSAAEDDSDVSCSSNVPLLRVLPPSNAVRESHGGAESRLYSAMCTPPRLSSRLFLADDAHGTIAALFLLPEEAAAATPRAPVVEVATSGDLVDLAVEWSESESQTMYYAAKFYDSAFHASLLALLVSYDARQPVSSAGAQPRPSRADAPNTVWKLLLLLSYTFTQALSDPEVLVGVGFLSVGLTALAGLAHAQPEDQGGMYNTRGLVFMAFVLVLFTNLATMDDARAHLRVALAHRKRHLYGTLSFVACLGLRVALIRFLYLALFFPFVVFVLQSCYALVLLAWLVSCAHAAFQYLAAAALPSRWWTVWAWSAYFGYCVMFSGFLLNLHTIPAPLGTFSLLRWGYGAVLHTWLHGKGFQCDGAGNTSYCYTGDDYLAVQGLREDSVQTSAAILSVSGVVVMGMLAIVLRLESV